jgi:hypothetical protein
MLDINTIVYQLPIEVDCTKLLTELDNLVLPHFDKDIKNNLKNIVAESIAITGHAQTPPGNWYNTRYNHTMTKMIDVNTGEMLSKNYSRFTLGFPGAWRDNLEARYDNDVSDRIFTHWHPDLIGSEMFNLKNRIAYYLKVSDQLRCRVSFIHGSKTINFHSDPHTPWRVHINLKSGPATRWFFRTLDPVETIEWAQPAGSVWLVRTGNVQHSVEVAENETRWQLFYHIWQRDLGSNYHQIA